jgi:hypothetical protein
MGFEQGLLHGLVRVVMADDLRAVADERRPVAVHNRLERRLGAEPDQLGQPLIALHPQREGGEPSRGSQSWVHGEWRRFGQLCETSVVGS